MHNCQCEPHVSDKTFVIDGCCIGIPKRFHYIRETPFLHETHNPVTGFDPRFYILVPQLKHRKTLLALASKADIERKDFEELVRAKVWLKPLLDYYFSGVCNESNGVFSIDQTVHENAIQAWTTFFQAIGTHYTALPLVCANKEVSFYRRLSIISSISLEDKNILLNNCPVVFHVLKDAFLNPDFIPPQFGPLFRKFSEFLNLYLQQLQTLQHEQRNVRRAIISHSKMASERDDLEKGVWTRQTWRREYPVPSYDKQKRYAENFHQVQLSTDSTSHGKKHNDF